VTFLPTVFISVTNGCNSRCRLCGIWKGSDGELTAGVIEESVAGLQRLGLRNVVITGGEPLMREDLPDIARRLSSRGLRLILCTNGVLLRQHREEVLKYFSGAVVSLDSYESSSYRAIRGVDAFDEVIAGIESMARGNRRVTVAHTLQKENILRLAEFIGFAKGLPIESVSVRPIDAYSEGFGSEHGQLPIRAGLLPSIEDLAEFHKILARIEREFSADLASGFITPSIQGLRKIQAYFQAKTDDSFPITHCNAHFSSCVVESNGDVKPCFFAETFANIRQAAPSDWERILNSDRARGVRKTLQDRSLICRQCAFPYISL
jgi:radical SAM protein with 4Fe4S-binding SPASM domain